MLVYFFYEFIGARLLPFFIYRVSIYIAVLGISPHDIPLDTIHATAEKKQQAKPSKNCSMLHFFHKLYNYIILYKNIINSVAICYIMQYSLIL